MFKQSDFFQNVEGLNLTDSQFFVKDGQATGGYNYDYVKTGGIKKILGIGKINGVADSQLNTLGSGVHNKVSDNTKTVIRAAGTKLQVLDPTAPSFTNQVEDTATAGTDFLSASSTQPVVFSPFSTSSADELWGTGGGMSSIYGYVSYVTNGEYSFVTSGAGSGLFVTGNTVAVTVNGRSYSIPFLTDNLTTLTNVAVAISADKDISSAFVADNIHTITVISRNGATLTITGVVTGGATQPTITSTNTIAPGSYANITANGVQAPTGNFTAVNQGSSTGGTWVTTGVYYYALALRKKSTQAISNCSLDVKVTIATTTDSVLLTFPTGIDATKYDKWYVYRSSVGGVTAFTAGTLVAMVNTNIATFTDTFISFATSQNVPRSGNGLLDNSPLPTGTYTTSTFWKRRLVTAQNSTLYISDLNKPESFPTGLYVTIPTGGPIRAVSVIGSNPTNSPTLDEFLVIHKDTETWVITGDGSFDATSQIYNIALNFVDYMGCPNASLVVRAGGFLCWVDTRGIWMWNGVYKPVYVSRPIEALFGEDGDLDKTRINKGWGVFSRKKNAVIWTLSSRVKGENKIQIKLDLRLTAPGITEKLTNAISDGVFTMDSYSTSLYAGVVYIDTTNNEKYIVYDADGFAYNAYASASDNGSGIAFNYTTKAFDCGLPSLAKQFSKVVVWIDRGAAKDLTLKYWAGYRTLIAQGSKQSKPMDPPTQATSSVWDLAIWDNAYWDDYQQNIVSLVFNLDSSQNNNQGEAIMLDISQTDSSAPVLIHGFSIFWTAVGLRLGAE